VVLIVVVGLLSIKKDNFTQIEVNTDVMEIYNRFKNRFVETPGPNLPGIDQVYVISMPQRIDYIKNQMEKLNYSVCYFNAVKPDDLSQDDYDRLSNINDPDSLIYERYTRLAVMLSFTMCFVDALVKGHRSITIFEDDISVNVSKKLLEETTTEYFNSNIDVMYMGYCFLNCGQSTQKYQNIVLLSDPDLLCCHAMCVKTGFLPGLINFCFPMLNNSDELFRDYYQNNNILVGVPKTAYFAQNRKDVDSLNESMEDLELFKTCEF
jgi:GR25 family glycosyltransferase involved in LPS biosynthesis